jgi:hypothetical protein
VAVKRAVLIICVLALIIDLTQDGALGQVKFVSTSSPHKSCFSQCKHGCSDQVNSPTESLLVPRQGITLCDQIWLVESAVPSALKLIHISLLGSAGGIPLKVTPPALRFPQDFPLTWHHSNIDFFNLMGGPRFPHNLSSISLKGGFSPWKDPGGYYG